MIRMALLDGTYQPEVLLNGAFNCCPALWIGNSLDKVQMTLPTWLDRECQLGILLSGTVLSYVVDRKPSRHSRALPAILIGRHQPRILLSGTQPWYEP